MYLNIENESGKVAISPDPKVNTVKINLATIEAIQFLEDAGGKVILFGLNEETSIWVTYLPNGMGKYHEAKRVIEEYEKYVKEKTKAELKSFKEAEIA